MTELLTAARMRAIERAAIDLGQVTGLELMERAGRGVVEAILEWRPELAAAPHRAVVLCGPGNNGGDGFVVARILTERGWEVEVFLYGRDPDELDRLPSDAAENARRWKRMGSVSGLTVPAYMAVVEAWGQRPDLCVDALFGTGLTRPVEPDLHATLEHISGHRPVGEDSPHRMPRRFVAIDCPSGVCVDSGRWLEHERTIGAATFAQLTVTFHRPRVGHYVGDAPDGYCWGVKVVDIGLPEEDPEPANDAPCTVLLTDFQMKQGFPAMLLRKRPGDHKYDHGHALILAGGAGRGGAARLAARGALRVGAGLVTVGAPPEAIPENAARLDAIMLRPLADAPALDKLLYDARLNAIGMGPGLGVGERTRKLVITALEGGRGTVLDADALTSFADDPEDLFRRLHDLCVLTPHLGEFRRLFPDIADKLDERPRKGPAYSRVDAAREAAARAGCTVLLKGADTVIADPRGGVVVNAAHYERAAPWLATAGAGDVLAGMITGLLARDPYSLPPWIAAETAAWLHVEAARRFGPGLIAEDLPETIPAVFRDLGL